MFDGLQTPDSLRRVYWLRRYGCVATSVGAHLAMLAFIVLHSPRILVLGPTWLAWGNADRSYHITYIPTGDTDIPISDARLTLPAPPTDARPRPQPQTRKPQPLTKPPADQHQLDTKGEEGNQNTKAGSLLGTVLEGPISGHEVHVAYPIVYPDPPVDRSQLPRDLVGDVVIEVTIDAQGNVVETKIVEAIGHGIDEKIEATLRRWHYQPATLDGTPVASRHDVHFHFPS